MNTVDVVKPQSRAYRSPRRAAASAQTRLEIVRAAKELFEERGWAGTTVPAVAIGAGVSTKTVEALYGTKAALLRASVDYAISGDLVAVPMPQRESVARMERAPSAVAMLDLYAAHVTSINARSARLAGAVEHAAAADPVIADLWHQMNTNRTFGVRWAVETLLAKPDRRRPLARRDVETTFWVAIDWGTFRTLTQHSRLSGSQ